MPFRGSLSVTYLVLYTSLVTPKARCSHESQTSIEAGVEGIDI
jgi:hypothetical protein